MRIKARKRHKTSSREYTTLREYIDQGLQIRQTDAAFYCQCSQPQIAKMLKGHLPPGVTWDQYLEGLHLTKVEFKRLTLNSSHAGWGLELWDHAAQESTKQVKLMPENEEQAKEA